jgi:transposase
MAGRDDASGSEEEVYFGEYELLRDSILNKQLSRCSFTTQRSSQRLNKLRKKRVFLNARLDQCRTRSMHSAEPVFAAREFLYRRTSLALRT